MNPPGAAHAPLIPATRQGEPNVPQLIVPVGLDDLFDPTPHEGHHPDSQRFQEMRQGRGNRSANQQPDSFFPEPQGLTRRVPSPQFHRGSSAAARKRLLDDEDVFGRIKDGRDGILPDGQGNLHSASSGPDSSGMTDPLETLLPEKCQDPCHRTGNHQNSAIIDTCTGSGEKADHPGVA
jgi:hypothetical protein